ncbi:hypothetical protein [Kluyvera chengduensis]|uniref:hypothetical protein n=1 Tax=Kluyvera sp. 142359 TaxID=3375726 RepID=UPI003775EE79
MVLLRACCSLGSIMGITLTLTMAVITVSLTTLNLTLSLSQGLVIMPIKALFHTLIVALVSLLHYVPITYMG